MRIICRGQHLNSMVEDSHSPIISDNGSGSLSKIARPWFHHDNPSEEKCSLHKPTVYNCRCETFPAKTNRVFFGKEHRSHLSHKAGRLARWVHDETTLINKSAQRVSATHTSCHGSFCALCTRPNGQRQRQQQLKPTLFHQINRL
jgi:hypothetical protein